MIELDNRTGKPYNIDLLEKISETLSDREIELILTDNDEITHINRDFRGIDKPTDVLSFPSDPFPNAPLGSIIISIDKVEEIAQNLGHSNEDELSLLFIHGMLHLLGMDHEVDKGEMRREEERIVNFFNLPSSLIVRTEGE
ncbi:MAG: rRNA maturation RNase YbeY [Sulfuricurvum sp.]|nr:rRNA maturation RNase YbeY [Sulfuricurvum sp.]